MWKQPWGLKEGFAICIGLFLTGIILQITVGKIDWDLFAFPVNIITLGVFIAGIATMHITAQKVYLFKWMSRYQAAVTAMLGVVAVTVIMGVIRQKPFHVEVLGFESWLGFSQMLSAWPFILLYMWFTMLVGMVTLRRLFPFRLRNIPFLLNHAGLFIAITAAVLGSADMQRLEMTASIGSENPEWRAYNKLGEMKELPLAVKLNEFTIDEYPPKLILIDNETGKALPEGKPANLLLEEDFSVGNLLDWHIVVTQHIPEAASMATEDTLRFVEFHSMGAAYAVYVQAENTRTGEKKEGWISGGSFMFPYKAIRLSNEMSLVMPEREPRRYASDVTIYTEKGEVFESVIEVNKPFKVDGWKIYQLNYDHSKGKWSTISIFELVRDPWLPVVYAGIWMLIAGAVCMFLTAGKTRKEDKK
ncbi:cytochrome c biogenesis protein ResB [Bacteroides sp. 519]|uniref:cytochrome c biogenesis protein ResB n=1 Tax=Bacteroides sp. 519 TaxID=2302937 RepID=UPI0013D8283E|nr:cytochrome c biogenesis protein ResB [Bacteroides sp. 519]NDV60726.1 hypothetical protein [Bacteroides sp. 519]